MYSNQSSNKNSTRISLVFSTILIFMTLSLRTFSEKIDFVFPSVLSRRKSMKNNQTNVSKILMCWERVHEEDLV